MTQVQSDTALARVMDRPPNTPNPPNGSSANGSSQPPRYMSVSASSRYWGFGRAVFQMALDKGELIGIKNGHLTMLETAAVERWIKSKPKYDEREFVQNGWKKGQKQPRTNQ